VPPPTSTCSPSNLSCRARLHNLLNLFDLAGVPVRTTTARPATRSLSRGALHLQPRPLASTRPLLIGDCAEFVSRHRRRGPGALKRVRRASLEAVLHDLARFAACYVPACTTSEYDGTRCLASVNASTPTSPRWSTRTWRISPSGRIAKEPARPLVEVVHDRLNVESSAGVLAAAASAVGFDHPPRSERPKKVRTMVRDGNQAHRVRRGGHSLLSSATSRIDGVGSPLVGQQEARPERVPPELAASTRSASHRNRDTESRRTGLTFAPGGKPGLAGCAMSSHS